MAKVKVTIIVSTDDANATARFTEQNLKEVLKEEFFDGESESIDLVEAEILGEN